MDTERVERKLAAILAADIVGYSRLMEADEGGTFARLKELRREIVDPRIAEYRGRIVKTTGDGMLVEFASVADAVQCAVEIQKTMAERNDAVPADRRIEFRIGINLGEIILEGGDIYGTGVNVAARLEGLSEPGGICISGTVYEQIERILNLRYDDLGEQTVKNISRPVRSYSVKPATAASCRPKAAPEPAPSPDAALELVLPDNPSIAVLPFDNMSADPEQEYFADGIAEDIITSLSKISGLVVIARNSSFSYKGKAVDVKQVARELGVHYVLEGSVRKAGSRVRITAQLIEAVGGDHRWAARFDRDLTDVFALQDEITRNVVQALHVRLVEGEQARVWHRSTDDIAAWDCLVQGLALFRGFTQEDNVRARALLEKAAALDPNYSAAYVWLAWTYWTEVRNVWTDDADGARAKAEELATKALSLDDDNSEAHSIMGAIHLMNRDYDQAIAEGQRAVALDPNGADVTALLAMTLNWSGGPVDAVALIEKAMRLSPLYSAWYLAVRAHALRLLGHYEEAAKYAEESVARNPNNLGPHLSLAAIYVELDRVEEARAQVAEVFKLSPKFSLSQYANALTYNDPAEMERGLAALRKAGFPD